MARTSSPTQPATASRTLPVGLHAEPQLVELAARIVEDLGADLEHRFPEIEWRVELGQGQPKDPQAPIAELVRDARQRSIMAGTWSSA